MFHFSLQACIQCGHPVHSFQKASWVSWLQGQKISRCLWTCSCHVYNNTNITTQASCPRPRPGSSPGDWNCRPPSPRTRSGGGLEQGGQSSCTWACRDSGHRGGLWWRRVRTVCHTYRAAQILHLSCDCQLVSVSMSMNLSLMLSVHLYFLKINLQKIFSLPKSYTIL